MSEYIEVKLTDEQKIAKGTKIGLLAKRISELEELRKEQSKKIKQQISELSVEMDDLCDQLRTGVEYKPAQADLPLDDDQ